MKTKILILGANSFFGSVFMQISKNKNFEYFKPIIKIFRIKKDVNSKNCFK